jgi:hypothetical protein
VLHCKTVFDGEAVKVGIKIEMGNSGKVKLWAGLWVNQRKKHPD